ncbi:KAP family P-loop NTPase fold protein [Microbulbifer sp. 2201CG32-9]|uniref:KAP family P-loop NTPase fold protein n=1 Tax=Microbulbifer sp. 2201CG32-9 TaxID=3232309 RepID=UPI00345BC3C7
MRLANPPIEIDEDDSFKNDIFERRSCGQALLNFVTKSENELVISLDANWGEGKTTFAKMWQGMLSKEKIPNIYIDAFASDYLDDPFITIAGAVNSYLEKNKIKLKDKSEEFKRQAANIGAKLAGATTKMAIKAATLGVVGDSEIEALGDIKSDLARGVSNAVGDFIEERLTSHAKDIKTLESFKSLLSELPSLLSPEKNKPLVIIIDELDRCRPNYAVEILEKIKHLFLVKNVVFLLVMHKKQLEQSIKCVYGDAIEAQAYLQKFINFELSLPKNKGWPDIADTSRYNRYLFDWYRIDVGNQFDEFIHTIDALADYFNISLRQLERAYASLSAYYASASESEYKPMGIVIFLCVIKVTDIDLFNELMLDEINFAELSKKSNFSGENISSKCDPGSILFPLVKKLEYFIDDVNEVGGSGNLDKISATGLELKAHQVAAGDVIPYIARRLNLLK